MDPRISELVARVHDGHLVTADELKQLLAAGVDADALLDAFVAAAHGAASRRFHRALGLLRDVRHGRR